MEKEEYWDSFVTSGKVADYLRYCHAEQKDPQVSGAGSMVEKSCMQQRDSDDKVKQNAGFY